MNTTLRLCTLGLLLSACSFDGNAVPTDEMPTDTPEPTTPPGADASVVITEINLLTYNVAGLPEPLSGSKPAVNTVQISPLLNDYAVVLVQEDFAYHDELISEVDHAYRSEPAEQSIGEQLGDGLNRLSTSPFAGHERIEWEQCHGTILGANDCLTPKGFTVATHTIDGVEIDVYNLHMDAGRGVKDTEARAAQVAQIVRKMDAHSADRPLLVAGDTNLKDGLDEQVLADFLAEAGIVDACQSLSCPDPHRLDRVFVRGTDEVEWAVTSWSIDERFVDGDGEPLSDHEAVATSLTLSWR